VDIQYLGLDDFLEIASEVLGIDITLLVKVTDLIAADSALNAPAAAFGGVEFYPDFATKVAILGFRLVRHHALPDGNKRAALLSMIEFAERNERQWEVLPEDQVVEIMVEAAAGTISEEAFTQWVSTLLVAS
jgi:death-on-curing protein